MVIRLIQGYVIDGVAIYELKWLLLGEWLGNGFQMYSEAFDYTGPIAAFVYKFLNAVFGRSYFSHYALSSLLIIYQAAIFNQLLLKNKAYQENSYMPAFLYVVLMISVPDFMALSPQLMSLTFILLALRNVLRRIDNQVTDELFLNSGIFVGIATMIYLPASVFLLVFLVSLIWFSSAVSRRILLYLFSFGLVFVLCSLYFFWRGDLSMFLDSFIWENLLMSANSQLDSMDIFLMSIGIGVIFVLGVFKTWSSVRLTNFQQKIQQVIWLVFFGALGTFFLSNEKAMHELVFMVPVIAYFWVYYFLFIRRRIFQTIMPPILIFGLIGYSLLWYGTSSGKMLAAQDVARTQSTMVLGESLSIYLNQEVLSPCFDKRMCERGFEGLDYYSSATRLYQIFDRSKPEIIIDQMGVMQKVIFRFPEVDRTYRKRGTEYVRISN